MPQLTLYIDTQANQLVTGTTSTQTVQPSSIPLFYGDTLSLVIYLLTKTKSTTRPNDYDVSIVNTAGLQLFLYLDDGTVSGTIYTQQIVWTPDANNTYFSANLALNTAALLTLIGTSTSGASCWLKIGYVQGGLQTTVLSAQVTVGVGLPTSAVVVPAGQTNVSAEVANATYFPQAPVNGKPLYLASESGKVCALYFVDNPDGTASFQASQVN